MGVTQTDNLVLYYSSFSLVLFALKVVDSSLSILEQTLERARVSEDNKVASGIRMVHGYANTKRIQGITKSGSEKARRIEDASILGAFLEVLGMGNLLGTESKTMYEDEHVKVIDNEDDGTEESNPVVVDTEAGHAVVDEEGVQAPVVNEEAEIATSPVPVTDEVSDPAVLNEEAEQVSVVEEVTNPHIPETDEGVDTEESVPAVANEESEEDPVVDEETKGAESDTEEDLVVVNVGAEQVPVVDEEVKGADSDTEEEAN